MAWIEKYPAMHEILWSQASPTPAWSAIEGRIIAFTLGSLLFGLICFVEVKDERWFVEGHEISTSSTRYTIHTWVIFPQFITRKQHLISILNEYEIIRV
ncbi:MAG: hypothetical protein ACFFFC_12625 [Candidatus Thorarchaeota archaeon]